jgi:hypothetical protein
MIFWILTGMGKYQEGNYIRERSQIINSEQNEPDEHI